MVMRIGNISDDELDILKEITTIGAGNAATSLSKTINKKIELRISKVYKVDFLNLILKHNDKYTYTIAVGICGKFNGKVLLALDMCSARELIKVLVQEINVEISTVSFNEIEISALKELGNIIAGTYSNAISTLIKEPMLPGIPEISMGEYLHNLNYFSQEYSNKDSLVLCLENKFEVKDSNINGYISLISNQNSYDILFKKLRSTIY